MLYDIFSKLTNLLTWFFVVAPWEQAIRIRLGNHSGLLKAGVYVRIPFVDRIFQQSIRYRLNMIRPQTLTTSDGKIVTCTSAVGFFISDLFKLYNSVEQPNDTVESEVSGMIADYIGKHTLKECSIVELQNFVVDNLDLGKYGLEGKAFYITSFAATKTYRFITGDMPSWCTDGKMTMGEQAHSRP